MYFTAEMTVDQIKARYRELAQAHHGDAVAMQVVNSEYAEAISQRLRKEKPGKTDEEYARLDRYAAHVRAAIEAVISLPGITIEICGWWLWITGDTYPHREALKAAGYSWSKSKRAWYYAGCPSLSRYRSDMSQIRRWHGSDVIKDEDSNAVLPGVAR